jgi:hypothetical protein
MLVTVVAFTFLNSEFSENNTEIHFANTVAVLVELAQNNFYARLEYLPVVLLWPMVFMIVNWALVGSGEEESWPYTFLDLSSPSCFVW